MLQQAAGALGSSLCEEVVFIGGACIVLWLSDPGAPSPRPTKDVDVLVEVGSRLAYERFSEKLRARGFSEDAQSDVICRWRHFDTGFLLDVLPTNPEILGFVSRWQPVALTHAVERELPSGAVIRVISPPYLLATKLEAFADRGRGDILASRDFEDIVTLIDGRAELPEEIHAATADVRGYIAAELAELRSGPDFLVNVAAMLRPDLASQARAETVVLPRIARVAVDAG
jgi:predicted nucleotidyltransferase